MARRHSANKRVIFPDTKYHNVIMQKFINCLMKGGKKSVAERIFYGAIDLAAQKLKIDSDEKKVEMFLAILAKVRPAIEVRSRRVGGATYQVPTPVREARSIAKAIKWLIEYASKRSEQSMMKRLAGEFMDAFNDRGSSVKKREDTHKMAEANKAFAHFAWVSN
ncbi:MAG: 30S ribosomal protein S7 [Alphaproteobacteria bacterium 33-17]|nr:MAG: 30S ribosomal protein S7 [Alphaproteobacteria bacterium 33-17]